MDQHHQKHISQTNLQSLEIENSHQNIIYRSNYLIWSLQFVASLSLLSLFISYLTGISLYYSYTYYFSTFFLPLLTHTLERKYVFLFCNGIILVFLVGLRGLDDDDDHHHHYQGFDVDISVNYKQLDDYGHDTTKTSLETDVSVFEDQSHDTRETPSLEDEVGKEDDNEEEREDFDGSNFVVEDEDPHKEEEEDEEEGGGGEQEQEQGGGGGEEEEEAEGEEQRGGGGGRTQDDEDEGDNKELVRTISGCTDDELNKKFDEFIRKMKEELRLEANEYQLIPA